MLQNIARVPSPNYDEAGGAVPRPHFLDYFSIAKEDDTTALRFL